MPKYHLKHTTHYQYLSPITDSANQIILTPQNSLTQQVIQHDIKLTPVAPIDYFHDFFGNIIGTFTIIAPHQSLSIEVIAEVETMPGIEPIINTPIDQQWLHLEQLKFDPETMDYLKVAASKYINQFEQLIAELQDRNIGLLENIKKFSSYIYSNFIYKQGVTTVETNIDEIWDLKAGVCQDFAHLLLELLRLQAIPSRYVSGYICPTGQVIRGEGATHAWVECFIPSFGWVGIDPTNNCIVSDGHIKIAVGRDFNDCTPVKGTYKGTANHTLSVHVIITKDKSKISELEESYQPEQVYVVTQNENTETKNSYQQFLEAQQEQQ
jgi:transglutaminase-like putative cysteine protease